ncbi:MAG: GNAT family N-acetyltransferase [Promethearchaeota archaeon]|nr:MAG: GNAT family N-acetyltransferase [Candidatus Lokiarchaeota archaeon]
MMHDRLRSIRVTSNNEAFFYDYIKNNFAEYFFFHVDYAQYPESTQIYMALDDEDKIQGMVLIWKDRRIQLRGTSVSLGFLLNGKNYNPISITGFDNHKELISKFFPDYKKEIALYRMVLKKGDQKDFENYSFQKLTESHREELTSLMRIADPIYWGSREPEDILIDENNTWYGIMNKKDLICIVGLWKYEGIGYIAVVGTHPDYLNRGYASSLISSTLKELFQDNEQSFITVRMANAPAIHTYKKLGFSICNVHYSYERL